MRKLSIDISYHSNDLLNIRRPACLPRYSLCSSKKKSFTYKTNLAIGHRKP